MWYVIKDDELYHHGVKGQKWGVRRFQNPDGTLTAAGEKRYAKLASAKDKYENTIWLADERNAHGEISDKKHERLTANAVRDYAKVSARANYQDAKAAWKDRTKETKASLYADKTEAKAAYKSSKYATKKKIDKTAAKVYARATLKKKYSDAVINKAYLDRGSDFVSQVIREHQKIVTTQNIASAMSVLSGGPGVFRF